MSKIIILCPHDFFIAQKKREAQRIVDLIRKKEALIRERTRSYWEAQNLVKNTSLALVHESIFQEIKEVKCICYPLNLEDEEALFVTLLNCAFFIVNESKKSESSLLRVHLSPSDIFSFRIASFVVDVWNKMAKEAEIVDYEGHMVLPLYKPQIRDVTLTVLFSIIDFRNQYGNYPNFEDLRNHNFEVINQKGLIREESIYRRWSSADDRRYVSTLYASLRQLRDLKLILEQKEMVKNREKIVAIRPTLNGFLSILFSDMIDLIMESMVPPSEEEY